MPIQVLPTHLVNKIAAGEVIERPASVVKELVENALDAGAGRVDVTIEDGGRRLIAVSDDGGGMSPQDAALAFVPHATSKVAGEDDLYRIRTMGFRGEALASIASISHAHIRTRQPDHDGGYEVQASGETVSAPRPCAAAVGTTVTVRDLFFNTPARRKFLKTAATEFAHISEQITRLALPHCRVAFSLTHNGRSVLNLPACRTTAERAGDLLGRDLAGQMLNIAPRGGEIAVNGLVARPAAARSSARWQWLFLNGRYIRDRLLNHALREAYRGLAEGGRFPPAVLFVELPPEEVDVNVHPAKIEVRFRDGQAVYATMLAAVRETLASADLTTPASLPAPPSGTGDGKDDGADGEQRRQNIREAMADFFRSLPPPPARLDFPPAGHSHHPGPAGQTGHPAAPAWRPAAYAAPPAVRETGAAIPAGPAPVDLPAPASAAAQSLGRSSGMPQAIQVHDSYIVASCPEGLLIIDQHALHERILYNDLRRRLGQGPLSGQRMLIPPTVEVSAMELEALNSAGALLGRLGLEVEPFGPTCVAIQRFPSLLAERRADPAGFLRGLLDRIGDGRLPDEEHVMEDLLQHLACQAAVKAGQPLSSQEIDDLLAGRASAEMPSSCPHGRPTTLRLTLAELEKQFKRT